MYSTSSDSAIFSVMPQQLCTQQAGLVCLQPCTSLRSIRCFGWSRGYSALLLHCITLLFYMGRVAWNKLFDLIIDLCKLFTELQKRLCTASITFDKNISSLLCVKTNYEILRWNKDKKRNNCDHRTLKAIQIRIESPSNLKQSVSDSCLNLRYQWCKST